MNQQETPLIKWDYFHTDIHDKEGAIKVTVSDHAGIFIDESLWPLSFRVFSITNKIVWDTNLYPGVWSMYGNVSYCRAEVLSKNGKIKLGEWKWDPFVHGDFCHQSFYLWALENAGSRGVAIGTHDGTSGEWVGPVLNGLLSAVLVEPSSMQHRELVHLYGRTNWVEIVQHVITPEGGEVDFFEAGPGHTNSVNPEHLKRYLPGLEATSFKAQSITLRQLLDKHNIGKHTWWLHLDVEDLDDKLLLSFDHKGISLPSCLIFEHENLTQERDEAVLKWCANCDYEVKRAGRNTICFLNK